MKMRRNNIIDNKLIFSAEMLVLLLAFFSIFFSSSFASAFEEDELWAVDDVNDLEFDPNNRLEQHWLLFTDNSRCRRKFSDAWGSRNFEQDRRC